MVLAKVVGNIVATVKHAAFANHKLMLVRPVDERGEFAGETFIAVDNVQAGAGDTVLVLREGNGVRQILGQKNLPIRSIIVGIVDEVNMLSSHK
jgi:microcompartment protein CcmK/EutM